MADCVAIMHKGGLQQAGKPEDVYRRPANRYAGHPASPRNRPFTTFESDQSVRAGHGPQGLSIAQGYQLMRIARSTYHKEPKGSPDDTALVEAMHAIKDESRPTPGAACRRRSGIGAAW